MLRCIELGKNGLGTTAPNPMVGCVIVHNGKIIGEGYTSPYGGAHAEVNAIKTVENPSLLSNAILYVTLEPCAHFGKTPPCVNLIVSLSIPKVVIGITDPNPKVAGKSIAILKENGCTVNVGVLEEECRAHHKRFLMFQESQRPYIVLKWAQTEDGFLAPEKPKRNTTPKPFWITNPKSKQLVHKWRGQEQAILVGTNTVLEDNPKLNIRDWSGKNPVRIIIDKDLKIPKTFNVLNASVKTIIVTAVKESKQYKQGIDYELVPFEDLPQEICNVLYKHEISSVLIEGGSKTLQAFIDAGLWDEARIFTGNKSFKIGIKAPALHGKIVVEKGILNDKLTILQHD